MHCSCKHEKVSCNMKVLWIAICVHVIWAVTTIPERVWVVQRYYHLQGINPGHKTPGFQAVSQQFTERFDHGLTKNAVKDIIDEYEETGSVHNRSHHTNSLDTLELDTRSLNTTFSLYTSATLTLLFVFFFAYHEIALAYCQDVSFRRVALYIIYDSNAKALLSCGWRTVLLVHQ